MCIRDSSQGFTANLCAIDLSKAFDKVNHHALFIKLMRKNIPANLIEIIENLFSGCLACIRWETPGPLSLRLSLV